MIRCLCSLGFLLLTFAVAHAQGDVAVDVVEVLEEVEFADNVQFAVQAGPQQRQLVKLQTFAKVECAFVRRVCKLTKEQTKSLSEIDDKWVEKATKAPVKKVKGAAVRMQEPGLIGRFFGAQPVAVPVRNGAVPIKEESVRAKVVEHIESFLDEKQKKDYTKAREQREESLAMTMASAMVESLDSRLAFTDEQRKQLKTDMLPWMKKNMNVRVDMFFNGNDYYPDIPTAYLKSLTAEQKQVFSGLQRYMWTDDENFQDGQEPIVIKR